MKQNATISGFLLAGLASVAWAQGPTGEPMAAETQLPVRLRLTLTDGSRRNLEVLRMGPEGFVGRPVGRLQEAERVVSLDRVDRAERSRGRRRGRSAVIGALVGSAIGGILLAISNQPEGCTDMAQCIPLLVLPPTLLGAGVGAAVAREQWEPLDLGPLRARPGVGSALGRPMARSAKAGVSFTVRF